MSTTTKTTLDINCRCGATHSLPDLRLGYDEVGALTCAECEQVHYLVGVIDRTVAPGASPTIKAVAVTVDADEVPPLLVNIHGGEILCERHRGFQLRSAMEAKPRARSWATSFGTYKKVDAYDVASFKAEDLTVSCESCPR